MNETTKLRELKEQLEIIDKLLNSNTRDLQTPQRLFVSGENIDECTRQDIFHEKILLLHKCIGDGFVEGVRYFLSSGIAREIRDSNNILYYATNMVLRGGSEEILNILIEEDKLYLYGPFSSFNPLIGMMKNEKYDECRFLIKKYPRLLKIHTEPSILHTAVELSSFLFLDFLIKSGLEIPHDFDIIYSACKSPLNLEVLLLNGFKVNKPFENNQLPITIASVTGKYDALDLFLKYGADPNIFDECYDCYPIETVSGSKGCSMAHILINYGARIENCKFRCMSSHFKDVVLQTYLRENKERMKQIITMILCNRKYNENCVFYNICKDILKLIFDKSALYLVGGDKPSIETTKKIKLEDNTTLPFSFPFFITKG